MAPDQKALRITLYKSRIGSCPKVRKTLDALGLRRVDQVVMRPANDGIRGMVRTVRHLVKVEEA
jgi:large subunit ribosomal protein L30